MNKLEIKMTVHFHRVGINTDRLVINKQRKHIIINLEVLVKGVYEHS